MSSNWKPNRPVWLWRERASDDRIRGLGDAWPLHSDAFEGEALLREVCDQSCDDMFFDVALACILVLRVVADCVRRHSRGEDLADELESLRDYNAELELTAVEFRAMSAITASLHPLQPAKLADELLVMCRILLGHDLRAGARAFAELAYETAMQFEVSDARHAAALALGRLALLEECPRSARLWQGRAGVHQRRVVRRRSTY
ncbi:MAG TPA: hypothetical protein VM100_09360 [Longimicrobiales bacterium]|nr:hypothetical protein [Longimicrobiales bacterium]